MCEIQICAKFKYSYVQSGFFWGSGEANSQTNSPQEADDRPKSLQSVNSVALMVC